MLFSVEGPPAEAAVPRARSYLHISALGCVLQYCAIGPAELTEQRVAVNSTPKSTTNLSFIYFLLLLIFFLFQSGPAIVVLSGYYPT